MDKNSAEEGHYNNIIYKRLAGEISFEDAAKPCDTTNAGLMLHNATTGKFVSKLQEALCNVQLISTSGNDCSHKKIVRNFYARVSCTGEFCLATCVSKTL